MKLHVLAASLAALTLTAGIATAQTKPATPATPAAKPAAAGAPVVVDASRLRSKSKNSPFDGRRLQGRVVATFVGGHKMFEA